MKTLRTNWKTSASVIKLFFFGLSEKIIFLESKLQPYVKAGVNLQYVIEDNFKYYYVYVVEPTGNLFYWGGRGYPLGWNTVTLNGNLALGILFNRWLFL